MSTPWLRVYPTGNCEGIHPTLSFPTSAWGLIILVKFSIIKGPQSQEAGCLLITEGSLTFWSVPKYQHLETPGDAKQLRESVLGAPALAFPGVIERLPLFSKASGVQKNHGMCSEMNNHPILSQSGFKMRRALALALAQSYSRLPNLSWRAQTHSTHSCVISPLSSPAPPDQW